MPNTHKKLFLALKKRHIHAEFLHIGILGILTIVTITGAALTEQSTFYQGHFLYRSPRNASSTSVRSVNRVALRKIKRIERRRIIVARPTPTLVAANKSDIHPAAPLMITQFQSSSSAISSVDVSRSGSTQIPEQAVQNNDEFPPFMKAMFPVTRTPDWGAMYTPQEWSRLYTELGSDDFVKIPDYDMATLTAPVETLKETRDDPLTIRMLTAKLFYSTRYFGAYDIDASEFSGVHPGVDLKLAEKTPIAAIAGGKVHAINTLEQDLGLHMIIEHHAPDGQTYYSVYGHLEKVFMKQGQAVEPGTIIGTVGMTGTTTGPHLHLQVDRAQPNAAFHVPYWPKRMPSRDEADRYTVHPLTFISLFAQ